jgi:hypothetical protein
VDGSLISSGQSGAEVCVSDLTACGSTDLPPCELRLITAKGAATYERLAALLASAGQLAPATHLALSRYALLVYTIHKAQAEGRPLRASWLDQLRRAEQSLGLDTPPEQPTAREPSRLNRYTPCGFPDRQQNREALNKKIEVGRAEAE